MMITNFQLMKFNKPLANEYNFISIITIISTFFMILKTHLFVAICNRFPKVLRPVDSPWQYFRYFITSWTKASGKWWNRYEKTRADETNWPANEDQNNFCSLTNLNIIPSRDYLLISEFGNLSQTIPKLTRVHKTLFPIFS